MLNVPEASHSEVDFKIVIWIDVSRQERGILFDNWEFSLLAFSQIGTSLICDWIYLDRFSVWAFFRIVFYEVSLLSVIYLLVCFHYSSVELWTNWGWWRSCEGRLSLIQPEKWKSSNCSIRHKLPSAWLRTNLWLHVRTFINLYSQINVILRLLAGHYHLISVIFYAHIDLMVLLFPSKAIK